MTTGSLEERVAALEYEVERQRAINECMRLMGRYAYLHVKGRQADIAKLYAQKTPGVCVQLGELGVYDGPEGLQRVYGGRMFDEGQEEPDRRGFLFFHPNECPYIEVAKDLKTAKGVWITDGMECGRNPHTGQLDPHWAWGSYGVDFIKEDGEWKFWHFHIYRLWGPHYNTSWVEWDAEAHEINLPDAMKPDRPGKDDYPYRANQVFVFKPDPPEPHDTWDESTSYIPNS